MKSYSARAISASPSMYCRSSLAVSSCIRAVSSCIKAVSYCMRAVSNCMSPLASKQCTCHVSWLAQPCAPTMSRMSCCRYATRSRSYPYLVQSRQREVTRVTESIHSVGCRGTIWKHQALLLAQPWHPLSKPQQTSMPQSLTCPCRAHPACPSLP